MRNAFVWTSVLVLATLGCKPSDEAADSTDDTTQTSQTLPEGVQLVKLNLPAMT